MQGEDVESRLLMKTQAIEWRYLCLIVWISIEPYNAYSREPILAPPVSAYPISTPPTIPISVPSPILDTPFVLWIFHFWLLSFLAPLDPKVRKRPWYQSWTNIVVHVAGPSWPLTSHARNHSGSDPRRYVRGIPCVPCCYCFLHFDAFVCESLVWLELRQRRWHNRRDFASPQLIAAIDEDRLQRPNDGEWDDDVVDGLVPNYLLESTWILGVRVSQKSLPPSKSPSELRGNRGDCCVAGFALLYLAYYVPSPFSCHVSMIPDATCKRPRVFLSPERQGWRLEATMLGNKSQFLSVSSSSAKTVLQYFS